MGREIQIGRKTFKYKKDALSFYKQILNSYKFGQSLNIEDFNSLSELCEYSPKHKTPYATLQKLETKLEEVTELKIIDVKVSEVQFKTKCFELFWNDQTSEYISYISLINRPTVNYHSYFNSACRNCVQDDIIALKQNFFSKNAINSVVICQETNIPSKWEDLVVDHRQPNTFSIIIDRFKELNNIEIDKIEYVCDYNNKIIFANLELINKFRIYHKEKANLRIVRKEMNLSRTNLARLKRTSKDLKIE